MYEAMHAMGRSQHFIIQDLVIPAETVEQLIDYLEKNISIYLSGSVLFGQMQTRSCNNTLAQLICSSMLGYEDIHATLLWTLKNSRRKIVVLRRPSKN